MYHKRDSKYWQSIQGICSLTYFCDLKINIYSFMVTFILNRKHNPLVRTMFELCCFFIVSCDVYLTLSSVKNVFLKIHYYMNFIFRHIFKLNLRRKWTCSMYIYLYHKQRKIMKRISELWANTDNRSEFSIL